MRDGSTHESVKLFLGEPYASESLRPYVPNPCIPTPQALNPLFILYFLHPYIPMSLHPCAAGVSIPYSSGLSFEPKPNFQLANQLEMSQSLIHQVSDSNWYMLYSMDAV